MELMLLSFLQSQAQQPNGKLLPSTTIRFQSLTIDNGLSQGYISSIAQDKHGFLWIATSEGLNRYDGYSFTIYKKEKDSLSPASNDLKQVFSDTAGRVWITYNNGGLDLFDKELGRFIHVIRPGDSSILYEPTGAFDILGSCGNGVVIVFNRLLYTINVEKITIYQKKKGQPSFFLKTHCQQLYPAVGSADFSWVSSVKVSPSVTGAIWMVDIHSSLFELKINLEKKRYKLVECVVPPDLVPPHIKKASTPYYTVDRTRGLVYFQQYSNIYRLNERSGVVELFMEKTTIESQAISATDANGDIWLSQKGELYKISVAQKKLFLIKSDNLEIEKKKAFSCFNIYVDFAGNIWICTIGYGLLKINLRNIDFHHTNAEAPVNFSPRRISTSVNGNFHIVPWRGDDFLFDTVTMKLVKCGLQSVNGIPFLNGKRILTYPFTSGKSSIPVEILNAGNYFLREWDDHNLALIEPQKGFVAIIQKKEEGFSGHFLLGMSHTIWLITDKGILRSIHLATGVVKNFELPDQLKETVHTMARDHHGNIWIATEKGVCSFNISTGEWSVYLKEKKRSDGLLFNNVVCISFSRMYPDIVWLGTEGEGFIKMNIENGSCKYYIEENGLPDNVVYSILPDSDRRLWMSTNRGVSCFDPDSNQFRNFTYEDGLQSNEFNRNSYGISRSGWMILGGINGINYFNPEEIVTSRYNANILLTNIFVNGEYMAPWAGDLSLRHSLYTIGKEIKLSHQQNVLNFRFSSSDLTTPEVNRFSYKLQGIDKEWSLPSTGHEATYTYLPPGNYVFKVRGTNRDGIWSPNELSFPFLIMAPWWQTWWFKSIVVLLIIGAAYGLYKFRMNQLLRLQAVRNRISADMHDEIGSTLSSISFYSQALLMQNLDQKQKQVLTKIKNVAQTVQDELSDIVWSVKADMDSFENIFIRMQRVGNELLGAKNIYLHFKADEKLLNQKMEMMMRKNFYLLFKEALNNAAKYAQCKNVWVIIEAAHPRIRMEIRDDGVGFDLENAKDGNGLENMRQRAESMKGKLTICSTPGKGTEVILLF